MNTLTPIINEHLILTHGDYLETQPAEMTGRCLQAHEYNLTEWYGYGTIAGLSARATYITGPEDDHIVEANGGDWSGIDWLGRLAKIDIMTDDHTVCLTLPNPYYDAPDQDWTPDTDSEAADEKI